MMMMMTRVREDAEVDAEAEAKEAAADVSGRDCTRRLASRKNKMRMKIIMIMAMGRHRAYSIFKLSFWHLCKAA